MLIKEKRMKKITLDVRPELHYKLRLLSVLLGKPLSSIVSESLEKLLENYPSITNDVLRD